LKWILETNARREIEMPKGTLELRHVLWWVLAIALLCVGAGCAPRASEDLETVVVTIDDNGKAVELQEGQILAVSLASNPSTGYRWEREGESSGILEQQQDADFEADSGALGAPGTETLYFSAQRTGQVTLKLVYRRPWETGVEPADTFTIEVTVQ
jgi:inhibitor of cysteine peptidase